MNGLFAWKWTEISSDVSSLSLLMQEYFFAMPKVVVGVWCNVCHETRFNVFWEFRPNNIGVFSAAWWLPRWMGRSNIVSARCVCVSVTKCVKWFGMGWTKRCQTTSISIKWISKIHHRTSRRSNFIIILSCILYYSS